MKFKITIEIDSESKNVRIIDEESGKTYEMNSVMLMAGGPSKKGDQSTLMLAYGNSNVFADIVEDHVFRTAVEKSWAEHILFDKIYYGVLAGKILCKSKGVPIEFPAHPEEIDPETLLNMLDELENEKKEEEREKRKSRFTLHVNRDDYMKRQ